MYVNKVSFLPETVIWSVHEDDRPAASRAVYFTVCGVELTTNSLLSAPTSFVIVGATPVLSTAVALGMQTFLKGFPGSVPTEIDWGQVIVGGRMSESSDWKDKL